MGQALVFLLLFPLPNLICRCLLLPISSKGGGNVLSYYIIICEKIDNIQILNKYGSPC